MKYIVEIKPEYEDSFKGVMVLGAKDSDLFVDTLAVDNLEELNSDYINEHFGSLQDDAYKRGLEDGKWKSEDGCTGCKYEGKTGEHLPCDYCMNNFKNQWTAKDDEIEVGDEVEWDNDFTGDRFIVTRIYQPYGKKEQCDGIDDDGDVYRAVLIESLVKTGRHYDIDKILEEMRND